MYTTGFCKIDTEGFEPNVIKGMRSCIQQFRPLLFFEIYGLSQEQQARDLADIQTILTGLGYRILNLSEGLPQMEPNLGNSNLTCRYFIACTDQRNLRNVFLAFGGKPA